MSLTAGDLIQIRSLMVDVMNNAYHELFEPRFERLEARMDALEARMDRLEERMDAIEARMNQLEERMDRLEERMDKLEMRMDAIEKRMDAIEERMNGVERRLGQVEFETSRLKQAVQDHSGKILALENDIKELYRIVAKLDHPFIGSRHYKTMTDGQKIFVLNSAVGAIAKRLGITLG